jgi:hypothetical protein
MSSEKKKNEMDRRNFLKCSLVGTGVMLANPLEMFLANFLMSTFTRANALAAGDVASAFTDQKLIHYQMMGGYPRYYWDLPLTPNAGDIITPNPQVITRFKADATAIEGIGADYSTVKVGDYFLPSIWGSKIATPTGSAPMSNLASNMLMMRGINLNLDSHELDGYKQATPIAGGPSLTGLVADQASSPIPSVGNQSFTYKSPKGISMISMTGNDPFTLAMRSFAVHPANMIALSSTKNAGSSSTVGDSIDNALNLMKASAGAKHPYLATTFNDRANAKTLLLKQYGNLTSAYTTLVAKYENLISRSFGDSSLFLAGVEDLVIPGNSSSSLFDLDINGGDRMIRYTGTDLRSIMTVKSTITNLAASMAIAEFMITQGYSSSVQVYSSNYAGMTIDSGIATDNNNAAYSSTNAGLNADSHFRGAYSALAVYTRVYRAISSVLYELTNQLKAVSTPTGNLFDNTAISVTTEFNRRARMDAAGADHGWDGCAYTVISGMIPKLTVVGDIQKAGSYGEGATMSTLSNQVGGIGNAASTVSHLMGVTSPTPNSSSYVTKDATGKVASTIGKPQNS